MSGRLTLNPASHIDPVGTLILPLFMVLMGGGMIFGWGRPVATQPSHFRIGKRWGDILVSLAGPFSNIALGTLAGIARGIMDNAGFDDHALFFFAENGFRQGDESRGDGFAAFFDGRVE